MLEGLPFESTPQNPRASGQNDWIIDGAPRTSVAEVKAAVGPCSGRAGMVPTARLIDYIPQPISGSVALRVRAGWQEGRDDAGRRRRP